MPAGIADLYTFDPGHVLFKGSQPGTPYVQTVSNPMLSWPVSSQPGTAATPVNQGGDSAATAAVSPFGTLAAESVRSIGTGPFDPSYRQNLATYAGGQYGRPSGAMAFNPTSPGNIGQTIGGGNAPTFGMMQTLLSQALGGLPFSWTSPAPSAPSTSASSGTQTSTPDMDFWLDRMLRQKRGMGMTY